MVPPLTLNAEMEGLFEGTKVLFTVNKSSQTKDHTLPGPCKTCDVQADVWCILLSLSTE